MELKVKNWFQENFGKRGKRSPQFGPGFGNFNGPTKRPRPTLPPLTAEELLPGFPLYNEDFVSRPEFANQIFPFITPVIATTTTSTTSSSSTTTTTTTKIKIPNVNEPSSTSSPLSQKKIESTSHKVETSTSTSTSVPFTSLPQNRIVESSKTETKAANANIGLRQETGTTAATTATTTTATTTTSSTSITKSTILTVKEIENPKVFETITKGETEEEAVDVRAISVAEIKDDLTPLQMVDEVNLSKENVTSETNAQIVDTQPVIKTDTSKETPIKNVSPPKKNNFTIQSLIEPASLIPHPTRTIEVQTKPSQGSSDPQFLQSQPSTFFPIHRQGQTTNSHQNPRLPMSPQTVSYSGNCF